MSAAASFQRRDDEPVVGAAKRKASPEDDRSRRCPSSLTDDHTDPADSAASLMRSGLFGADLLQSLQYFALLRQSFPNGQFLYSKIKL